MKNYKKRKNRIRNLTKKRRKRKLKKVRKTISRKQKGGASVNNLIKKAKESIYEIGTKVPFLHKGKWYKGTIENRVNHADGKKVLYDISLRYEDNPHMSFFQRNDSQNSQWRLPFSLGWKKHMMNNIPADQIRENAATKIQTIGRMLNDINLRNKTMKQLVKMQSKFRGNKTRKRLQRENAALKIQTIGRMHKGKNVTNKLREKRIKTMRRRQSLLPTGMKLGKKSIKFMEQGLNPNPLAKIEGINEEGYRYGLQDAKFKKSKTPLHIGKNITYVIDGHGGVFGNIIKKHNEFRHIRFGVLINGYNSVPIVGVIDQNNIERKKLETEAYELEEKLIKKEPRIDLLNKMESASGLGSLKCFWKSCKTKIINDRIKNGLITVYRRYPWKHRKGVSMFPNIHFTEGNCGEGSTWTACIMKINKGKKDSEYYKLTERDKDGNLKPFNSKKQFPSIKEMRKHFKDLEIKKESAGKCDCDLEELIEIFNRDVGKHKNGVNKSYNIIISSCLQRIGQVNDYPKYGYYDDWRERWVGDGSDSAYNYKNKVVRHFSSNSLDEKSRSSDYINSLSPGFFETERRRNAMTNALRHATSVLSMTK